MKIILLILATFLLFGCGSMRNTTIAQIKYYGYCNSKIRYTNIYTVNGKLRINTPSCNYNINDQVVKKNRKK